MLLLSLFWAWLSWNAYHPWKGKPEIMGVLSFIFGLIAGELPLHLIATEVAITLLVVGFGDLNGFSDALALGIALASWLALLKFHDRAAQAEPVLREAVSSALGQLDPGYDPRIAPPFAEDQPLLNPFDYRHPLVQRHQNIPYCDATGSPLHVDIYQRRDCPKNAPVLFQIHGGAWLQNLGSKEQQALPLMRRLALEGWVCVSVQYRLSPKATFPDHIIDCKKALVWVKENIHRYGGNPEFIVATGGSAGGHLSSLLALSANAPEFQPGFEQMDTRVQGCVPIYGVYDFTNSENQRGDSGLEKMVADKVLKITRSENPGLWRQASPLYWVNEQAPPFLLIHGEADTLVPVEESRLLYAKLKEVSHQPVAYAELPDAQHAFELMNSRRTQITANALCFYLDQLYQRHLSGSADTPNDNVVNIAASATEDSGTT
ncbi:MAG: alpha/beta hydrolase [Spongiibacter sp.]|nr:alpha/beta hydrolase [Spongiibacter sp.]